MLVKSHREFSTNKENEYFSVSGSEKGIYDDLRDVCKKHPHERVYYSIIPVRPSKTNYLPEYMMEIVVKSHQYCGIDMFLWERIQ